MEKYIKALKADELHMLSGLFDYNDVDEMITENKKKIENGMIDIFCLFEDLQVLGELRVMYSHEDELFAVEGKRAYLYAFRIHKDFQGNGFGKYLLNYVITLLAEKGYTEITVGVEDDNKRALHIYDSFGFNEIIARRDEEYQGDKYEYKLYLKR